MTMTKDQKADAIITSMSAGTAALAAMPPVVDMAVFAAAIGGSVVGIAACYDVTISKGDARKLIMDFIKYGGIAFTGGKILSGVLKYTGVAYAAGGLIDAALYTTIAYAIGVTAKAYYRDEIRDPEELKRIFSV
jgi:uncharacterized protein (DUF697 family)